MSVVFPAKPITLLKTTGGDDFPVNRVFCVGRSYAAHAREMGADPVREAPFFFTKWAETVVNAAPEDDLEIPYPPETTSFHHEVELVVAIGKTGSQIAVEQAQSHIWGYAVGLDMTRRDLQAGAKAKGRPWDVAKNVENSCPTGRLQPIAGCGPITAGAISLQVNGALRQSGDIADMIWTVPEIIADLSRFYTLAAGDLIYTGTPAGVGPVVSGDRISCEIAGLAPLSVRIGGS
ncbi:MAG: fumarylacetoacetate hydrolase family protein [Rhodobacteraceae bacterium]|nr:fumarylacetoacetate hydrolase family protein [Paracoccaceae bacterium]